MLQDDMTKNDRNGRKVKKTSLLFTGNLILIVAPGPGWPTGKAMSETLS